MTKVEMIAVAMRKAADAEERLARAEVERDTLRGIAMDFGRRIYPTDAEIEAFIDAKMDRVIPRPAQ